MLEWNVGLLLLNSKSQDSFTSVLAQFFGCSIQAASVMIERERYAAASAGTCGLQILLVFGCRCLLFRTTFIAKNRSWVQDTMADSCDSSHQANQRAIDPGDPFSATVGWCGGTLHAPHPLCYLPPNRSISL